MTQDQEKRLLSLAAQSNLGMDRCKEVLGSCDWDVAKAYNLLSKISYEEYMKKQGYEELSCTSIPNKGIL